MQKNETSQTTFEKKFERLDIRVSYKKKEAFTKACEEQGDTPSNAVRRFITSYTRRANHDNFRAALRTFPWRRMAVASIAIMSLGVSALMLTDYLSNSKESRIADIAFKVYDVNKNGLIDLGEILPDDYHLHRVLNIDGEDGISRDEFYAHATMVWKLVDEGSFTVVKNDNGRFRQSSVTRSMTFQSEDTKASFNDPNVKKFIIVDGKPVELKNEDDILKHLESKDVNVSYKAMRKQGLLPKISTHALQKYGTRIVKFDLRNPDKLEFTVLEQKVSGFSGRSIGTFQRSVSWVEGRKTPELVMGIGREKAVLTKDLKSN